MLDKKYFEAGEEKRAEEKAQQKLEREHRVVTRLLDSISSDIDNFLNIDYLCDISTSISCVENL